MVSQNDNNVNNNKQYQDRNWTTFKNATTYGDNVNKVSSVYLKTNLLSYLENLDNGFLLIKKEKELSRICKKADLNSRLHKNDKLNVVMLPQINNEVKSELDEDFVQNQDRQIYSDSFKEWFGDWENDPENASKVVDEDGKPLVVGIDINRAYQLQNIEKSSVSVRVHNINASSVDLTDDIKTISDLWKAVKQEDKYFKPKNATC